jgi:hypothetical protein
METTCTRCHQSVPADSCYCPSCGLPQLMYSAEPGAIPPSSERWPDTVRDASSIDWRSALRGILVLAAPAGLLTSQFSPLRGLGIFWMSAAAGWAVALYMRKQRPAWITIGAGARMGLVTGLIAGWLAFGLSGASLFVTRVVRHQGREIDSAWVEAVTEMDKQTQRIEAQMSVPYNAALAEAQRKWMLSPEGEAGFQTVGLAWYCSVLTLFAVAGGAIGARMVGRRRRPEI